MIIPYYEYNFASNGIPKLKIIRGPKCQLIESDLKDFLSFYGFENVVIEKSVSSYR